ncbi:hypothetical protein [Aquimarina mytili]|uniref:Lipocalin-like domain-containing protein n=1 Tax=Aquimarina mytili TaxID=874423 RepID=A0A937D573_9FLAO|nr:hypothetical protein [Aquimarina mytili]MBL0682989.1 hypothetical protein [Aquimarina mytili]
MKTQIKRGVLFLALSFLVLLISCKTDNDEIINAPLDQVLKLNSKVATLILKTTMNDGSKDNILDGSSCFSIDLPVTINVNGLEIMIDSEQDFQIVEEIFDEFEDDLDELDLIFPITVILSDFSEIVIENDQQLEELIESCDIEDEDEDIECLDFEYPFTVSVFDPQNELIQSITFTSDKELFDFINDLDEDDIVNVDFPITVILSDGAETIINNLDQLENVIEAVIDDCDENDLTAERFTQVITIGSMKVQKYKDNENNETENYDGYVFNFYSDGTSAVTIENENDDDAQGTITTTINGTWSVTTRVDGGLNATFDFGAEEPLSKLNIEWNVKKIKDKRIMFDNRNGEGISKDELFFIKN